MMKSCYRLLPVLFLLLFVVFSACEKDADINSCGFPDGQEAKIIGQDVRLCACCGGWFIELGADTVRTFTFPDEYILDSIPVFPIEVCLSYEEYTGPCDTFGDLIVLKQIEDR